MDTALSMLSPKDFPPLLREIPDAPKKLHVRGTLPSFEKKWLAVVGSRAVTPYGKQVIRHLIEGLRGYPIVIVSGNCYGVDAEAHSLAMECGLPTVGVPGSGLNWNVLYPRMNLKLAERVVESGGALVSEFEPDMRATPYTFPKRNRVMAGMCHATLMIEAKERSGSLITARLTTEYNRELLVVPGSIFSAESRGTHQFLKLGATPVTEPEDVLRALNMDVSEKNTLERSDISAEEKRVLELLASPLERDELLRALKMPVSEAQVLLSMMEIKGLLSESLGMVRKS